MGVCVYVGGVPYLSPCLLCFLFVTGFNPPQKILPLCELFYHREASFLSTPRLIHIERSFPSQLRCFHVNGVLITPLHRL